MRLAPQLTYCGLTIVLSNPSRFDVQDKTLLARFAGKYVNDKLCLWGINRFKCDIRTLDTIRDARDLLPQTKVILALGTKALRVFSGNMLDETLELNQQRGAPGVWQGVPYIASYLPQDCFDVKDWEGANNPLAEAKHKEGEDKDDTGKSRKMHTQPGNYKFWLACDIRKVCAVLRNDGVIPRHTLPTTRIYPDIYEVTRLLETTKNCYLNLDIENDNGYNIYCIGLSFNSDCVYVVPIVRHNYTLAYSAIATCKFLRALGVAMRDNTTVLHNSQYDLWVMAHRYGLPFGRRIYDTMLAQHRCFVDTEKSLGHTISYWLYEPYHKGDAIFQPTNDRQERQLWEYNGKDVAVLDTIRQAQCEHALTVKGLTDSIEQSNDGCYAYLTSSLLGMRYDSGRVEDVIKNNDAKMMQLIRMIRMLTGGQLVLPTSNKQCVDYFHDQLGYKPVKLSKRTGQPSLSKDAMYKLKLKHPDNAMIDVSIEYRRLQKETGSLGFLPWRQ